MVAEAIIHENGHEETSKKIMDILKWKVPLGLVPGGPILLAILLVYYGIV